MKIKFIGTGSAFTMKNFQTNIILEENGQRLLIDAGMDIRWALKEADLSYKNINALYITHQHADHCAGVEYLAFTTYFDPSVKEKITLYGNNELIRELWTHTLQGGLRSVQGKVTSLHDYFDVQMVKNNGHFIWQDNKFNIVQSIHIMDGYSIVNTYGLMITLKNGKKLFITGDVQYCPNQIKDFYREADYIIQDCETAPYFSGVHANYQELRNLSPETKAKMALVHYQDNVLEGLDNCISTEWTNKCRDDGFVNNRGVTLEYISDSWQSGLISKGTVVDLK